MISGRNPETKVIEPMPGAEYPKNHKEVWYRLVSWLFAHEAVSEAVVTRVHFNASPEAVWNRIMFYEEVPGRPPFLLRALLPRPVRTEGDKTRVGATVRCVYRKGDLVKHISTVEPTSCLQFEVVEQHLGLEGCILTLSGSYHIYACGDATDVVLTTNYQAYLHPRYLWRPLEALLVNQLHSHILRGVCSAVLPENPDIRLDVAESLALQGATRGDFACTASQACSRR